MKKVHKEKNSKKRRRRAALYILVFLASLLAGAASKLLIKPGWMKDYEVSKWDDSVGTVVKDISYGEKPANKFDLYLPADSSKKNYGLVVYLHAGGFTSGDKSDDMKMLEWLCQKGYVACGINYTLHTDDHPEANVYSQSMEIKSSMPYVVQEAEKRGYHINAMAISGGSAGHCLAMLYAYRDAGTAPVPVKMVFGAVGPSSFYPKDWVSFGFDKDTPDAKKAAAGVFGMMAGKKIDPASFGTPEYDEQMKDISALLWVDDDTVPSLLAYGKYDKMQSFPASKRLDKTLTRHHVPHDYIVMEHSGHGLQNDYTQMHVYNQKIVEYLNKYLPVEK